MRCGEGSPSCSRRYAHRHGLTHPHDVPTEGFSIVSFRLGEGDELFVSPLTERSLKILRSDIQPIWQIAGRVVC